MSNLIKLNIMYGKLQGWDINNPFGEDKKSDPQTKKCVGVWSDRDNTFLTQQDISINMLKEIEFHLKCLRDEIIDCEDFAIAIEQISAHYYAMNFELIKTR
tara:strand:- start:2341 stop:2643 length:303 start_codon:yes stop_codon:yes gene_type:complete